MATKRTLIKINPNKLTNAKRCRVTMIDGKLHVLKEPQKPASHAAEANVAHPAAQLKVEVGSMDPFESSDLEMRASTLKQTEEKVAALFAKHQHVGRTLDESMICELARVIYYEVEQKQRQLAGKLITADDKELEEILYFEADHTWFQKFCNEYNIAPAEPDMEIKINSVVERKKTEVGESTLSSFSCDKGTNSAVSSSAKLVDKNSDPCSSVKVETSAAASTSQRLIHKRELMENCAEAKDNKLQINDLFAAQESAKSRAGFNIANRNGKRPADVFVRVFPKLVNPNFLPQQVFNVAEMYHWWRLMPRNTIIYKSDKSHHRIGHETVQIVLCGNASGDFKVKPMLVHHSFTYRDPFGRVFLRYQARPTKAYLVNELTKVDHFFDWLHECFLPEVREYLEALELPVSALLLIDRGLVDGCTKLPAVSDFVQFQFLPANTAMELQPLNQTVLPLFICNYMQRLFSHLLDCSQLHPRRGLFSLWSQMSMNDGVNLIIEALDDVNASAWNSGWATIWDQVVTEHFDPGALSFHIDRIVEAARKLPDAEFLEMSKVNIVKHFKKNPYMVRHMQALDHETMPPDVFELAQVSVNFEEPAYDEHAHSVEPFESVLFLDTDDNDLNSERSSPIQISLLTPQESLTFYESDCPSACTSPTLSYSAEQASESSPSSPEPPEAIVPEVIPKQPSHKISGYILPGDGTCNIFKKPIEKRAKFSAIKKLTTSPPVTLVNIDDVEVYTSSPSKIVPTPIIKPVQKIMPVLKVVPVPPEQKNKKSPFASTSGIVNIPITKSSKTPAVLPSPVITTIDDNVDDHQNTLLRNIKDIRQSIDDLPNNPSGDISHTLTSLHAKMDLIMRELQVFRSHRGNLEQKKEDAISIDTILRTPFETAEKFKEFEERLQLDERLQNDLATKLSASISNNRTLGPWKAVEYIWKETLSDDAAINYVWRGRKGVDKEPIKDSLFSRILKSCFMRKFTDSEILFAEHNKRFFNYAHDRYRKRSKYIKIN